jgi:hypothetical protein
MELRGKVPIGQEEVEIFKIDPNAEEDGKVGIGYGHGTGYQLNLNGLERLVESPQFLAIPNTGTKLKRLALDFLEEMSPVAEDLEIVEAGSESGAPISVIQQEQDDATKELREQIANEVQRLFSRTLSDRNGRWEGMQTPDFAKERTIITFNLAGEELDEWLAKRVILCSTDGSVIRHAEDNFEQMIGSPPSSTGVIVRRWGYDQLKPVEVPLDSRDLQRPGFEDLRPEQMWILADALRRISEEAYIDD